MTFATDFLSSSDPSTSTRYIGATPLCSSDSQLVPMSAHYPSRSSQDASLPNTHARVQSSCASHNYQSRREWICHAPLRLIWLSWSRAHWITKRLSIPPPAPWSSIRSISQQRPDYLIQFLSTTQKFMINLNLRVLVWSYVFDLPFFTFQFWLLQLRFPHDVWLVTTP